MQFSDGARAQHFVIGAIKIASKENSKQNKSVTEKPLKTHFMLPTSKYNNKKMGKASTTARLLKCHCINSRNSYSNDGAAVAATAAAAAATVLFVVVECACARLWPQQLDRARTHGALADKKQVACGVTQITVNQLKLEIHEYSFMMPAVFI